MEQPVGGAPELSADRLNLKGICPQVYVALRAAQTSDPDFSRVLLTTFHAAVFIKSDRVSALVLDIHELPLPPPTGPQLMSRTTRYPHIITGLVGSAWSSFMTTAE